MRILRSCLILKVYDETIKIASESQCPPKNSPNHVRFRFCWLLVEYVGNEFSSLLNCTLRKIGKPMKWEIKLVSELVQNSIAFN